VDDRTKERLAGNEDLFRRINDEIEIAAERHGTDAHRYEFLCECSDVNCMAKVHATLAEYARAREDPTRFLVVKGHVIAEIEHVVEAAHDHVVIEKDGHAGTVAIELDEQADRD
jgi:hypothetical protein